MRSRRVAPLLVALALILTGCFPFSSLGDLGNFDDGDFPMPTVLAEYTTGSAQAVITQDGVAQTITFDHVGRGATLNSLLGAGVTWKTDDGWVLQVSAYDINAAFSGLRSPQPSATVNESDETYSGDVTLERIHDAEFWIAGTYAENGPRCIVDIDEVSETEVSGHATCRGLRWADGTSSPLSGALSPVLIEDQSPFDAEITFEARP